MTRKGSFEKACTIFFLLMSSTVDNLHESLDLQVAQQVTPPLFVTSNWNFFRLPSVYPPVLCSYCSTQVVREQGLSNILFLCCWEHSISWYSTEHKLILCINIWEFYSLWCVTGNRYNLYMYELKHFALNYHRFKLVL